MEDLPPYSYVTGLFPHPNRDPQGHSYGREEGEAEIQFEPWTECRPYLRGVELFNHGFYWESHELWEAVWLAAGRQGTHADFCKALIKLAAAGVKAREGRPEGVRRHARRAIELVDRVQAELGGQSSYRGLNLDDLRRAAKDIACRPTTIVDTRPDPVVVVMPFQLQLHPH